MGHKARTLMLYIAYLVPDCIPKQLVQSLVGETDDERLRAVVAELQALSLVRVVHSRDGEVLGLQVHC